jgi:cellulose synthase/poly-beta-1,6-N-acetylglucosamine synthase-like glycosyltransferase
MLSEIVLNLYLVALLVLGIFSVEALYLVYKYLRGRQKKKSRPAVSHFPTVTIQLPIYNEVYVARRLITAVCELEYPKDKLEIQVLDDSTDPTCQVCQEQVKFYQREGFDIHYLHRQVRQGYKAGALQEALRVAKGEFIAIFDADFVPLNNFLKKTIPFFNDPKVGMIQTRWEHLNEEYSFVTKAQSFGLAGHFAIEQNGRNAAGYFINFNGTAGVWRKSCIEDAGSWQADTLTEDLDLSYRAQLKGWKFLFLNDVVTPSELPAEINALKNQQYRWTKGAVETARKILPQLWKSNLPFGLKIHSTLHLTSNMSYPFLLILALLNLPFVIIKRHFPESTLYSLIFTFFAVSFIASFIFYAVSQKSLYNDWKKRLLMFPVFMSGSMGFSVNNTKAVVEGLLKLSTPFIRTPKYELIGRDGSIHNKSYRPTMDKTVIFEIAMAVYSCIGIVFSLYYWELGILPFMIMFFFGYSLIGYLSIKHAINTK